MPRDNQWTIQLAPKHRQLLEIIANEQGLTFSALVRSILIRDVINPWLAQQTTKRDE
jgi:hypothetical protein